jgi:hypothetical protein
MISTRTNTRLYICAVVIDSKTVDVYAANSLAMVASLAREGYGSNATYRFTRSTNP